VFITNKKQDAVFSVSSAKIYGLLTLMKIKDEYIRCLSSYKFLSGRFRYHL